MSSCKRLQKISNEELIIKILNSDDKVFEDIYLCFENKVIGWIRKNYIISADDAREIYQLVMIILYENIRNRRLTELTVAVDTYLIKVAKNKISELGRKKSKNLLLEDSVSNVEKELEKLNLGIDVELTEKRIQSIEAAFLLLGEKCQKILTLFYFEKKDMQEIANKLNFKSGEVAKNEKYRCIKKLRELVKNRRNGNE